MGKSCQGHSRWRLIRAKGWRQVWELQRRTGNGEQPGSARMKGGQAGEGCGRYSWRTFLGCLEHQAKDLLFIP